MTSQTSESCVASHYGRPRLLDTILAAVQREKRNSALTARDLAAVDEFHVGGIAATEELASHMELRPGMHLLDIGCGIGGPARYFSSEHGCNVDGIDLTAEFVDIATTLTRLLNLQSFARFSQASALKLPFGAAVFDGAYMIHVGMNLQDKLAVYREVARVMKPGALFSIFDFVRAADGPLRFPVPWAAAEDASFVSDLDDYRSALRQAAFRIELERPRKQFAIDFTESLVARMAQGAPPILGLHLLMGERTPVMIKNLLAMMHDGLIEPVEIYARRS